MAESHCAVESWKNFSLSKEQGEANGIAGKERGNSRVQRRPDAGINGTHGHGRSPSPADRSVPMGNQTPAKAL
jgi:hypothetical protein